MRTSIRRLIISICVVLFIACVQGYLAQSGQVIEIGFPSVFLQVYSFVLQPGWSFTIPGFLIDVLSFYLLLWLIESIIKKIKNYVTNGE